MDGYSKGYSRVAAFMNSDPDTALFRSFKNLQSRILLHYQAELSELEDELDRLDKADLETNHYRLRAGHTIYSEDSDCQDNESRRLLIEEMSKKLKEYGM